MIQKYWESFLKESKRENLRLKGSICLADNATDADRACGEVLDGERTILRYPKNGYRVAMQGVVLAGDMNIVVNWNGEPVCVIETVNVDVRGFDEMFPMEDAFREQYEAEFKRELEELGMEFDGNTPVCAEEFRVVWPQRV